MKKFLSLLLSLSISAMVLAQNGKISGRVINTRNEPLAGVSIKITGSGRGVASDVDGRYTLTIAPGKYEIEFTAVGYKAKTLSELDVVAGKVTDLDVVMENQSKDLGGVVVRATSARRESINAMVQVQKNTGFVAQVISAEAIRKSPDRNTGDALKRVSAVSLQDGKYIVVRGLADRYNQTMVNGALMSSTEPDRKTFAYDIFPSALLDNIILNKTAIPEYPAEFAGGLVQLTTKDIPSNPFLNLSIGTGINTQVLGRDFYTYKGGKTDWLGIDDGTRAIPSAYPQTRKSLAKFSDQEKANLGRLFANNWTYQKNSGLPNLSFGINGGWTQKKADNKNKWGLVYALNYNAQNRMMDQQRTFQDDVGGVIQQFQDDKYSQDVNWGALGNLSFQFNNNNKISFKNTFNVSSSDVTLLRQGVNIDAGSDISSYELAFKSNIYYTTQLNGEHFIPKQKIRLKWNGNFTNLNQNTPDLRRLAYTKAIGAPDNQYSAAVQLSLPTLSSGTRFFSELSDYIYGGTFDAAKSFSLWNQNQTIKVGYLYQLKDRQFTSRPLGVASIGASQTELRQGTDAIFAPANFAVGKLKMDEINNRSFDYNAEGVLNAGFIQLDNQFSEKWRLVWGARVEDFQQILEGYNTSNQPVKVNTITTDILPSANLTFRPNVKSNIRFAVSQTLIRPEFRELSRFEFFDFELVASVRGNEKLKRTKITNIDLRYELYPAAGELVTFGGFFKQFENPIEPFLNPTGPVTFTLNYDNVPRAYSYGVELDFRKKLDIIHPSLKNITLFSNLSYIFNRVQFNTGSTIEDRPMQGQSPYVINAGVEYNHTKSGTTFITLFNQVGRRIYFVGNDEFPDVYEAPRALLDMVLTKKVMKEKAEVKLAAADILNAKAIFYQNKNGNGKYDANTDFLFRRFRSGTNYSVTFSYKLK